MAILLLILLLSIAARPCKAQQPPDPRLSPQTIAAQQALLALREAQMQTMFEDAAKERAGYEARLETAMEWIKAAQSK